VLDVVGRGSEKLESEWMWGGHSYPVSGRFGLSLSLSFSALLICQEDFVSASVGGGAVERLLVSLLIFLEMPHACSFLDESVLLAIAALINSSRFLLPCTSLSDQITMCGAEDPLSGSAIFFCFHIRSSWAFRALRYCQLLLGSIRRPLYYIGHIFYSSIRISLLS